MLCFATYANAIEYGMVEENKIRATTTLFTFITEKSYVKNRKNNPYYITNRDITPWWNGTGDIPDKLQEAAMDQRIIDEAPQYFEESVIGDLLATDRVNRTYQEIIRLISDGSVPQNRKNEFLNYYNTGNYGAFLGHTFLYAIVQDNHPANGSPVAIETISEDVNRLVSLLKCIQPTRLTVPSELSDGEQKYVNALLAAYAEDAGEVFICREDLNDYPKYRDDFSRQRASYFAAESIRRSSRDVLGMDENDPLGFKGLEEDIESAIFEVYDDDYENGFKRLRAVLRHVTTVHLTKSMLSSLSGWVGNEEKKGICHIIVNDKELTWVNGDEVSHDASI